MSFRKLWTDVLDTFHPHVEADAEHHGGPLPDDYMSKSAADKLAILRDRLSEPYKALPTTPEGDLTQMIAPEYLQKTFSTKSDELPAHDDQAHRAKLIHCFGVGGVLRFTPNEGAPKSGPLSVATSVVARLSNGQNPRSPAKAFIPGVALKFLEDGAASKNILFGGNTDGQTDDNFFANPLHTWIPCPTDWQLSVLNQAFENAVGDKDFNRGVPQGARELPCDHLGEELVALQLRPRAGLNDWWTKNRADDFRDTLMSLEDKAVLFDVLSERPISPAPDEVGKGPDPAVVIGELSLDGKLVASAFCDRLLFFAHPMRTTSVGEFPKCPAG